MFGQLCVLDPLDEVGDGDGDAANAGDATTKAAIAAIAMIKLRTSLGSGLLPDDCGADLAPSSVAGFICSLCSLNLP